MCLLNLLYFQAPKSGRASLRTECAAFLKDTAMLPRTGRDATKNFPATLPMETRSGERGATKIRRFAVRTVIPLNHRLQNILADSGIQSRDLKDSPFLLRLKTRKNQPFFKPKHVHHVQALDFLLLVAEESADAT